MLINSHRDLKYQTHSNQEYFNQLAYFYWCIGIELDENLLFEQTLPKDFFQISSAPNIFQLEPENIENILLFSRRPFYKPYEWIKHTTHEKNYIKERISQHEVDKNITYFEISNIFLSKQININEEYEYLNEKFQQCVNILCRRRLRSIYILYNKLIILFFYAFLHKKYHKNLYELKFIGEEKEYDIYKDTIETIDIPL